ncbi:site-2 protease family protein [Kamptonema cortianum]|nr:site-2 protease family protein [Geitlerinema splendidum]MDK3155960.1 site-2 protease family protein [Kamptonema cortianum]
MELIQSIGEGLLIGVVFLAVITVLIYVHELGHYWFAKMTGMHVEAFAIMVGGIRKTPLANHLSKPLTPSWVLWAIGVGISLLTIFAGTANQPNLLYACMAILTIAGPVWVISRLCALYHYSFASGLKTIFGSWAAAAVILVLGTRFKGVDPGYALSIFLAASAVAVLLTYYRPVMGGHDLEGRRGHGEISVSGKSTEVLFRPLWARTNKDGTEFSLLLLPLGGFAAMRGMQPKEDGSETKIEKGFYSRPPWQRLIVLFAGPAFSILFGMALATVTFKAQGEAKAIPVVAEAVKDGPAFAAGLKKGDRILAVDGKSISTFYDVVSTVRDSYREVDGTIKSVPLRVAYERNGERFETTVTPMIDDQPTPVIDEEQLPTGEMRRQAKLGVRGEQIFSPVSWGKAAYFGAMMPIETVKQMTRVFTSLQAAKQNVGGPGAIVEATATAVDGGIYHVFILAASLSVVLGIMNLLPFPPLDGGQMVIAFAEMLRGNRRLSMNLQSMLHQIGAMFVLGIMVAAIVFETSRRADQHTESKSKTNQTIETPARD